MIQQFVGQCAGGGGSAGCGGPVVVPVGPGCISTGGCVGGGGTVIGGHGGGLGPGGTVCGTAECGTAIPGGPPVISPGLVKKNLKNLKI